MMATRIVTLDGRGRIVLPVDLRERLKLEPGDSLSIQVEDNEVVLRPTKAADSVESFATLGEREYRAGRTKNLRAFAEEEEIILDAE